MKKGDPALRKEVDGVWYLEAHPEVCEFFKAVGCYQYCQKLQDFHQQVAEAFALTYDGRKATIGKEEFLVDEALIAEITELPRTGECWFKTTVPAEVEFRSYLKPEHRSLSWKENVPMSFLEIQWQYLLKAIIAYITCDGRYKRVMVYHFKLLNHFTGRSPINLPYYFHKSLTKMYHQVKAEPSKIAGRLSHHGLITLIVKESLRKRNIKWHFFLFWNEFETELQAEDKGKNSATRKSSTPRTRKRKRRSLSPLIIQQDTSSSKPKRAKKKLRFDQIIEPREASPKLKNLLNLPYSDSEEEAEKTEEREINLLDQTTEEHFVPPLPIPRDEASSSKPKASRIQKINKLLRQVYEMGVLERVIKERNATLTERNVELYDFSYKIAKFCVKLKKRNKKLKKDNTKLFRKVKELKIKNMLLKPQSQTKDHVSLEVLANAAMAVVDLPQSSAQRRLKTRPVKKTGTSSKQPKSSQHK